MMEYYINSVAWSDEMSDIKNLIPDANMRRRMSRIMKMGVGTALECLKQAEGVSVDAIITTTGLGCLEDSEKFLCSMIENEERLLNPTPFMQSTFNTIGGQIALLTGNHCYNMTYSHRECSFESGLLDAMLLLEEGVAESVLLGAMDEMTLTQTRIMARMGLYRGGVQPAEGAYFFMISSQSTTKTLGVIEQMYINGEIVPDDEIAHKILVSKSYHTATAQALYGGIKMLSEGVERISIDHGDIKILIRCM